MSTTPETLLQLVSRVQPLCKNRYASCFHRAYSLVRDIDKKTDSKETVC